MTTETARHGRIAIAYETFGPPEGEPLLLIMGTGGQMLSWPDRFCRQLVDRGLQVARFDNRDTGLSTKLTDLGAPGQLAMLLRPAAAARYTLSDMAADAVAVLDELHWSYAHLVGFSQGGMIAQAIATDHPGRARTLTSISATPAPKIGKPSLRALARIGRAVSPRGVTTTDDLARYVIDLAHIVGSPDYPADETELRELAHRCHDRGGLDMAAIQRQTAAIVAAGDRRGALRGLRVPALVIHGASDPLILPDGGRATADAIPGAKLTIYPGMGHDLPQKLWTPIIDEIAALAGMDRSTGSLPAGRP